MAPPPSRGTCPDQGPTSGTRPGGGLVTGLVTGTCADAGLDAGETGRTVPELTAWLAPAPGRPHPWCAGAVVLAGRGHTVALHEAVGHAVRYAGYDEHADRGVELPPERRVPMRRDTVFDLASLTKLFTATAAVLQAERGTLDLDAGAAAYVPELTAAAAHGITVRHLLTHTSGLRPELPLYDLPDAAARAARLAAEEPLTAPGSTRCYSDLNLLLLQAVLERVTGRPLDDLIATGITGPLGMTATRFRPPDGWRERVAATEDQRRPWGRLDRGMVHGTVHDENAFAAGGVAGHAGLFSTAWDLALFARALLDGGAGVGGAAPGGAPAPEGGTGAGGAVPDGGAGHGGAGVLPPAAVRMLLGTDPGPDGRPRPALGFETDQPSYMGELAGRGAAGHTGFTGTSLVLDPATDTFLVLLTNSVHPSRTWRTGSAPRAAAATRLARAAGG